MAKSKLTVPTLHARFVPRFEWEDDEEYMAQNDIVKVVRCEECAIRYTSCPMVVRSGVVGSVKFFTEDNDYCSYGVAKGESDD